MSSPPQITPFIVFCVAFTVEEEDEDELDELEFELVVVGLFTTALANKLRFNCGGRRSLLFSEEASNLLFVEALMTVFEDDEEEEEEDDEEDEDEEEEEISEHDEL